MRPDKLVTMANQIGTFFVSQRGDAATAIANHIRKFWDPQMREAILSHAECGGDGLHASVRAAVGLLKSAASPVGGGAQAQ
jgi:formate dehydrogenase subunit delta